MTRRMQREIIAPGTFFQAKYLIGEVLGEGGYAVVYNARDEFLDEAVALKLIARSGQHWEDNAERARREAKLMRQLRHPNLVTVHEAGFSADEEYVYIAMEKLNGPSLRAVLQALQSVSVSEALTIAIQVARAMEEAHRANVVHRDLKPENIVVLPGNVAKVLDFGVAKFLEHGDDSTDFGTRGTPLYMSPEQLLGGKADPRTDVYALGVLVHEALAGCHYLLARNPQATVCDVGYSQIQYTPPLLSDEFPHIPRDVAVVVERMMKKPPEGRYANMAEAGAALKKAYQKNQSWALRRRIAAEPRDLAIVSRFGHAEPNAAISLASTVPHLPEVATSGHGGPTAPAATRGSGVSFAMRQAFDDFIHSRYALAVVIVAGFIVSIPIGVGLALNGSVERAIFGHSTVAVVEPRASVGPLTVAPRVEGAPDPSATPETQPETPPTRSTPTEH